LPSWWPQFSWKDWIYGFYHDDGFLAVSPYHPTTAMGLTDAFMRSWPQWQPNSTVPNRSHPFPTVAPGTPGVSGPCSARHRLPSWWLRQASPPVHGKFPNSNHLYICSNYVYDCVCIYIYVYIERDTHIFMCIHMYIYIGLSHG
jgi:hypothetical protein